MVKVDFVLPGSALWRITLDTVIGAIVVRLGSFLFFTKEYPLMLFNLSLCISRGLAIFELLASFGSLRISMRMNYESQKCYHGRFSVQALVCVKNLRMKSNHYIRYWPIRDRKSTKTLSKRLATRTPARIGSPFQPHYAVLSDLLPL